MVCWFFLLLYFFILVKPLKTAAIPGKKCLIQLANPISSNWQILVIRSANHISSRSQIPVLRLTNPYNLGIVKWSTGICRLEQRGFARRITRINQLELIGFADWIRQFLPGIAAACKGSPKWKKYLLLVLLVTSIWHSACPFRWSWYRHVHWLYPRVYKVHGDPNFFHTSEMWSVFLPRL